MTTGSRQEFDVVVVGGGHAGVEAAWAAANAGARVGLVTLDPATIGVMSCNPAIGGLAKGQMVREIDALGGLMGLATDATGIMFKELNASRGAAVRGPRAQCDKHAYAEEVRRLIASREEITVIAGAVDRVLVEAGRVVGVEISPGAKTGAAWADGGAGSASLRCRSLVLTTGTFMRGLMHTGESKTQGGRHGEAPAVGISAALRAMGFELGRLKTGTPPRLARESIDWEDLDAQRGDDPPRPFSDLSEGASFPRLAQVECRVTETSAAIHERIRANLHRAPMFSGQIEGVGPRYCPSIEDKVVRFADRESHTVFLEPESLRDNWVYCNGVSTSLPADVQEAMIRGMRGCERAVVLRWGYAVEYDMVPPHQIFATCMTRRVEGLFLAGQINGTSGYEEAAGQGLLAGLNAARLARGEDPITLGRDQAFIGVMMDDLTTQTPREPYRMFTSRAEHRLLLRADNAGDRLTPLAAEWGLVSRGSERWRRHEARQAERGRLEAAIERARVGGTPLSQVVRRPEFTAEDLGRALGGGWSRGVLETAHTERQYSGYIERQRAEVRRHGEMERRRIPEAIDYAAIPGLRAESREALGRFRPATYGQASRIAGVTPADLSLVMVAARGLGSARRAAERESGEG